MCQFRMLVQGILTVVSVAAVAFGSHTVQTNGPVSTQIVEDVWDSPEFCYPCLLDDTDVYKRTLRVETTVGQITALDVIFWGQNGLHQDPNGDGFSLLRDDDTHFLFDEVTYTLDVTWIIDEPFELSGSFDGFLPFTSRDVAHILLGGYPFSAFFEYRADVTVDLGNNNVEHFVLSDAVIPGFVPEPGCLSLLFVALISILSFSRRSAFLRKWPRAV